MKFSEIVLNITIRLIDYVFKYNNNLKTTLKRNFLPFKAKLLIVTTKVNWSAKWDGIYISENLKKLGLVDSEIGSPLLTKNKVIHWIAVDYILKIGLSYLDRENINISNWYHVLENDSRLKFIPILNKKLDVLVTPSYITRKMLIESGFKENKIVVIPLGVDLSKFKKYEEEKRLVLKKKYNLPTNKIIIGSFQKDGLGWVEGLEPKLEKGPDVFCEVVRKLKEKFDIHIFLTGAARGYVKKKLDEFQIPYTHIFLDNYLDIVECYNTLDLYIVTSRREGGPKSLLEGMATGIPLVTTNVGMASYLINHGINGFITDVDNIEQLCKYSEKILKNKELREKLIANGLQIVKKFTWENVAKQLYFKVYKKYLEL